MSSHELKHSAEDVRQFRKVRKVLDDDKNTTDGCFYLVLGIASLAIKQSIGIKQM